MTWATIITAIMAVVGPMLAQWITSWLSSHLNKTAATLPDAPTFGAEASAHAALLDAAITACPRFAFGRRIMLRIVKGISAKHLDGSPLSADEKALLTDAGSAADNE
jgi:hypothetical protein